VLRQIDITFYLEEKDIFCVRTILSYSLYLFESSSLDKQNYKVNTSKIFRRLCEMRRGTERGEKERWLKNYKLKSSKYSYHSLQNWKIDERFEI